MLRRPPRSTRHSFPTRRSSDLRSKHHSTGERTKKAAQIYLAQWVLDEQADQKRGAIVIVKSILADYKIEHVDEALLSKGTAEIGIRHQIGRASCRERVCQ